MQTSTQGFRTVLQEMKVNKGDVKGFILLRRKTESILKGHMDNLKSQMVGSQNQSRSRVEWRERTGGISDQVCSERSIRTRGKTLQEGLQAPTTSRDYAPKL